MYRTVVWLQFFTFTVFAGEFGPVVKISNGKIRGTIQKTAQQKNFHVFEGIPYAAPPIGNRRFKIPQEPDAWEDVFQAVNNSHVCMQGNELGTKLNLNRIETEDCLYLNVFTPADLNNADKQNLPVLVWIHGGSFQYGSKRRIQPHYFMDYDVVVVVINYRLGVFGFLSTQDGVIPGNLGLKDQRFALQWVSKNIKQFGGDPHKVTLAGQSAGSVAASYQLLALQNKEFIAGVILESGSALCHHDFQPTPKPIAYELGRLLDPKFAENSEDLLYILNKQSAEELKEASGSFSLLSQFLPLNDPTQVRSLTNIWLPVVEDANDPNNLIPSPMHQAFIDGNFLKVPVIAGFASEEIVAFSDTKNMLTNAYKLDDNPGLLVSDKLNIKNKRKAGEKLKAVYTDSFEKNPTAMIQFLSDNLYATPVLRQADLANKHTPVYLYQFSYQNSLNKKTPIEGAEGVGHGSELLFLFGNQTFIDKTDQLVHERMMKLWTNFIKFQNPTPRDDPILIKWPRTTSNNLEYLDINSILNISSSPRKYTGWKKVLDEFIAPPLSVY